MAEEQRTPVKAGAELDSALDGREAKVSESPAGAPGKSRSGSGAGSAVSVVLSLIAMGIAAYATYQVYLGLDRFGSIESRMAELNGQLSRANQQLVAISKTQQALTSTQEGLSAQMDERIAGLSREIAARSRTSSQDWIMAEVEYLVRLASQRVLIERQTSGAIALLESADRLIRDAKIASAFQVREALAGDIARLRSVGTVDAEGIYLQLGALTREAERLPVRRIGFTKAEDEATPRAANPSAPSGWREQLWSGISRLGSRLASLVDFRTGLDRIEPVLPPQEEYYLRQNLRLKLETAQLALLRGHQAAYVESLRDSMAWIQSHFDPDNSATGALVAELERLSQEKIVRQIPEITASLTAIRRYLSEPGPRDAAAPSVPPAGAAEDAHSEPER